MKSETRLFSSTLWLGLATALSKGVTFLLMPLYTAVLSPADFGVTDILVSTAVLLIPFASFCAPDAVFRFRAGGENAQKVLGGGLLLLLLGGVGLFFLFLLFPLFPVVANYRFLLLFYISSSVFHGFLSHWVKGEGEYGIFSLQLLFCSLATVLLQIFFLADLHFGIRGYLLAILLGDLLTSLMLLAYEGMRKGFPTPQIDRSVFFSMLRFALPLMPTAGLWWVTALFDHYLLLFYSGERATGLYAAAAKIPTLLTLAGGLFIEVWQYFAIKEREGKGHADYGEVYRHLFAVLTLAAASLAAVSRPLVDLLFAGSYEESVRVVPILLTAGIFSVSSSFLGSIYTVERNPRRLLITSLAGAAANVMFNFLLIPRYAALGAACSTVLSHAIICFLRARHVLPRFSMNEKGKRTAFSILFLLASAVFSAEGETYPTFFFAFFSALMLWGEMVDIFRIFQQKFTISLKKSQKRPN